MSKLLYVGQQVADDLKNKIADNIARYKEGDFLDLEAAGDWRIPLSLEVNLSGLSSLVTGGGPADEIQNSITVGHALSFVGNEFRVQGQQMPQRNGYRPAGCAVVGDIENPTNDQPAPGDVNDHSSVLVRNPRPNTVQRDNVEVGEVVSSG